MSNPRSLEEEKYDMSGARLALILCVTKAREGSEEDLDALEHMFRQLRFESTMKRDPTAEQFQEELEKFQQAIDSREDPVSCAFVVLMAHGREGFLKGEDGEMVKLENLFEALNNKNCQALRAKPKVYIIQACRGEQRDPGETVGGDEIVMVIKDSPQTIPTYTDALHVYSTVEGPTPFQDPLYLPSEAPPNPPLWNSQDTSPTDMIRKAHALSRPWWMCSRRGKDISWNF
ncbi:caspase-14 isoform X1 [Homo sapiens]|uniref:caspase-14 isoform X1 n=1 Tax=Homo sapiens TaxID=9606 RepID=UPI000015226C|nr:caspase-14 isoform X1 [Homo sapiens]XP_054176391.1 caspase-14 isoform X1 [Homo sapiens]|eukprot:XP_011526163.1 caspase-14 isoform X1 [Homo sapiens]